MPMRSRASDSAPSALRRYVCGILFGALLSMTLSACAADQPSQAAAAFHEPLSNFQTNTLTILTTDARQHVFRIWVADTEAHREQGLMFVQSLEPDTGMLFTFDQPQQISMWMKNTLIPLDMVFIARDGRVNGVISNAKPLSLDILTSPAKASAVLELKGGVAAQLDIGVGAIVKYPINQ